MGKLLLILRLFLCAAYFMVCSIISIFVCLFRPFNPKNAGFYTKLLNPIGHRLAGLEVEYRGMDEYEKHPKAVYMANHQENLDLFTFGRHQQCGRNVTIGKRAIAYIPIFGQVFWLCGHLLINRSNRSQAHAMVDKLMEKFNQTPYSLWIFPEGTRSRGKGLGKFKKGPFRMAIKSQLDIYPVVCSSYSSVDFTKWNAGKLIIDIMPPIPTKGLTLDDADRLREQTRQMMAEKLEALDAEVLAEKKTANLLIEQVSS